MEVVESTALDHRDSGAGCLNCAGRGLVSGEQTRCRQPDKAAVAGGGVARLGCLEVRGPRGWRPGDTTRPPRGPVRRCRPRRTQSGHGRPASGAASNGPPARRRRAAQSIRVRPYRPAIDRPLHLRARSRRTRGSSTSTDVDLTPGPDLPAGRRRHRDLPHRRLPDPQPRRHRAARQRPGPRRQSHNQVRRTRPRFTDEQQTTSSTTSSTPATAAPAESCRPLPASPRLRTTPTSPNKRTATVITSCGNRHPETPTARQVDGGLEVDAPA